ncbi:Twin-arginine translocation pathway signal [Comamonas sp. Tr-654]|uniref:molybdopterin-dependent oxidoreductase n=1 Tax=Comamonas sp. Tr-654 TaxID=2608341 RepID=UPI001424632E|nr:molybdopterin-dependent oxidoreductase [Comamonas sp. Tr-654]NIF83840.1 Twin-arginine translocation pathway signal [Comamonas sp. Tr-654]
MAEQNPLSRRSLLLQGGAAGAALGAMALPASATTTRKASRPCVLDGLQPAVLTISGPGVQANRGKPQAVADRMLIMHGYLFDAAWSCGMDALNSLEQQTLRTTLEYDEAEHSLQGPLLEQVLQAAGVDVGQAMAQGLQLTLQGIDGYRSQIPLAQAVRWRMLIATQLDGVPLAMGGVGPLWAIFAAHQIPELGQLPVKQRFPAAVWGLYHLQLGSAAA